MATLRRTASAIMDSALNPLRPSGAVQARGTPVAGGVPSPIQTGNSLTVTGLPNVGVTIPGTGVQIGIGVDDVLTVIDRLRGGGRDKPGSSAPTTSGLVPTNQTQCPGIGSVRLPDGRCANLGDALPGGDPFVTDAPSGGAARVGAFGLPAFTPAIVGTLTSGAAIRRCPRRTVLGMDNLCYVKGTIPRQFRKWPPDAKPPVTAFDARMMRKYGRGGSKAKAAAKLAQEAGYSTKQK